MQLVQFSFSHFLNLQTSINLPVEIQGEFKPTKKKKILLMIPFLKSLGK